MKNEFNQLRQSDIVYSYKKVTAFIALRKWPNNAGHVLIIPNEHYENLYYLPGVLSARIQKMATVVALTMKQAYRCDGILVLQRNEPTAGQRTFHYHLHVIPRYEGYDFDSSQRLPFPAEERKVYAQKLEKSINIITQKGKG